MELSTIILSVILFLLTVSHIFRSVGSVKRDIALIELIEDSNRDVKERLTNIVKRDTGAIQSKFDKENTKLAKEIEAVTHASKHTFRKIDGMFENNEEVVADHYKVIGELIEYLGLEVVQEKTETKVTPAGLRKKKKATKKRK